MKKNVSPCKKTIVHLDLDCFFVSCERIKNPKLHGIPVIVGGSASGRGVVSSASYEARALGVRSAMPSARAVKLCPEAVFLTPDFEIYSRMSKAVALFLRQAAPLVEQASIDEFYLDITGCERIYSSALQFGKQIKDHLRSVLKLPCTVAIASNKLVSKIAANEVKPDGLIKIEPGRERAYLAPLPIEAMPGIGKVTAPELRKQGFHTIGSIADATDDLLKGILGEWGQELKERALGLDASQVIVTSEPKSFGRETTFERDEEDRVHLLSVLSSFSEECAADLRQYGYKARTVTVKFRLPNFITFERSRTVPPTALERSIFEVVESIFLRNWKKGTKLRLIGCSVSNFCKDKNQQEELFVDDQIQKWEHLTKQMDFIRSRYGSNAIRLGSSLHVPEIES